MTADTNNNAETIEPINTEVKGTSSDKKSFRGKAVDFVDKHGLHILYCGAMFMALGFTAVTVNNQMESYADLENIKPFVSYATQAFTCAWTAVSAAFMESAIFDSKPLHGLVGGVAAGLACATAGDLSLAGFAVCGAVGGSIGTAIGSKKLFQERTPRGLCHACTNAVRTVMNKPDKERDGR